MLPISSLNTSANVPLTPNKRTESSDQLQHVIKVLALTILIGGVGLCFESVRRFWKGTLTGRKAAPMNEKLPLPSQDLIFPPKQEKAPFAYLPNRNIVESGCIMPGKMKQPLSTDSQDPLDFASEANEALKKALDNNLSLNEEKIHTLQHATELDLSAVQFPVPAAKLKSILAGCKQLEHLKLPCPASLKSLQAMSQAPVDQFGPFLNTFETIRFILSEWNLSAPLKIELTHSSKRQAHLLGYLSGSESIKLFNSLEAHSLSQAKGLLEAAMRRTGGYESKHIKARKNLLAIFTGMAADQLRPYLPSLIKNSSDPSFKKELFTALSLETFQELIRPLVEEHINEILIPLLNEFSHLEKDGREEKYSLLLNKLVDLKPLDADLFYSLYQEHHLKGSLNKIMESHEGLWCLLSAKMLEKSKVDVSPAALFLLNSCSGLPTEKRLERLNLMLGQDKASWCSKLLNWVKVSDCHPLRVDICLLRLTNAFQMSGTEKEQEAEIIEALTGLYSLRNGEHESVAQQLAVLREPEQFALILRSFARYPSSQRQALADEFLIKINEQKKEKNSDLLSISSSLQ